LQVEYVVKIDRDNKFQNKLVRPVRNCMSVDNKTQSIIVLLAITLFIEYTQNMTLKLKKGSVLNRKHVDSDVLLLYIFGRKQSVKFKG